MGLSAWAGNAQSNPQMAMTSLRLKLRPPRGISLATGMSRVVPQASTLTLGTDRRIVVPALRLFNGLEQAAVKVVTVHLWCGISVTVSVRCSLLCMSVTRRMTSCGRGPQFSNVT